jgi:NAD+--asparagine ADP-ribosyltransferase
VAGYNAKGYRHFKDGLAADAYFKKNNYDWHKKLTDDEIFDIKKYTIVAEDINDYLRDNSITPSKFVLETISGIRGAINKFNLKNNIVVYRSTSSQEFNHDFETIQNLTQKGYLNKGFLSASADYKATENFKKGENDILWEISVPAGRGRGAYINNISYFKDKEYEFLLKDGTRMSINNVRYRDGKYYIKAEVIS